MTEENLTTESISHDLNEQDLESDRFEIAPGQLIQCNVCATRFDTSEKACFVCFPPFGIDISSRCVACVDCWKRVTWRVDEESRETMLIVKVLPQGTSTSFGPPFTEKQTEAILQITGREREEEDEESAAKRIQADFDGLCEMK